ncbi:MAG: aminotransferase class I/II-fold pyridoxal phosphate-dependent enzyme [Eubacterium sp.]|jgi:lysine decarboxylase|nr:aminotransferase class I/II-fold pyridoxal phosphate-dependent enzyme [Eubacterium sp.]MCH4047096.1 aminotransferase class I/II-fold pyridoxal phosphate-dependent enzyme [Eubacterium sp.]MCH4080193.1 aminotransferase class I/II-fold pyridoxal phosphate-dependent enzyme [Eubacterium sp.]MCH4110979.1 aminotransferase class I/II-fold pyridoxal phosphate-dependent enzyme [Eubacterium sp.]MCI1306824.1 aminotransferase class I/II-fold pyridoxal phosphate-dependent enzyme [Eubacterium sp.]
MNIPKNEHLQDYLCRHAEGRPVRFHMPGHKGRRLYDRFGYRDFLQNFIDEDITEIPGADDLYQQTGVLRDLSERYRKLYGSRASYPLVNGSSCGLIAAILASVPRGEEILIARNCHKSVFNGADLAAAEPVYIFPEIEEDFGIAGGIQPAEVKAGLEKHPDAAAVVVTSPNYYGIQSNIREIADVVHEYGKILIVDQAHGAHLPFFQALKESGEEVDFRCESAEQQGADLVISSLHKTMASFGQTALLNLCGDRVSPDDLLQALQKTQTSSPSYLLMASMDINADILEKHGPECIREWNDQIRRFYKDAARIKGLEVMQKPMQDQTKLNISMRQLGLNGMQLQEELIRRNIWPELASGDLVMGLTGIGSIWEDEAALLEALDDISSKQREITDKYVSAYTLDKYGAHTHDVCKKEQHANLFRLSRREHGSRRVKVPIHEAAGRVCAAPLIPYPPGIPTICTGEVYTESVIDAIEKITKRGEEIQGLDAEAQVFVFL